jgi:amino acid transporter
MIDYVMTVAVSVASGIAAITSAFPSLDKYRVIMCLAVILIVGLANLRGLKESGKIFAVPTYLFIVMTVGMVVVGFIRAATGHLHPGSAYGTTATAQGFVLVFLLVRAFASGCTAMTGTEAISNGIPAFRKPESRNASITLGMMAVILGGLLVGITVLAEILHVKSLTNQTVLSQIGHAVYGNGLLYYILQVATMGILILAANTSFADFPRLSSILARDRLMPRQFMNRGDRLAFSNGIIGLAIVAMVVVAAFGASVNAMIPLYAVGVFVSFTLSQTGMVVHWFRLRTSGWKRRAYMNGFGAVATAVVAVMQLVAKFTEGAYIVVIVGVLLIIFFYYISTHYHKVATYLEPQTGAGLQRLSRIAKTRPHNTVVLFVSQVNEMTARSLALGQALSADDFHAVTVATEPSALARLQATWSEMDIPVPLKVIESPYREFIAPALDYIHSLEPSRKHVVTVVVPEFVVEHWWENALHNQNAFRLKATLLGVPWVVVISIPVHIGEPLDDTAPDEVADGEGLELMGRPDEDSDGLAHPS